MKKIFTQNYLTKITLTISVLLLFMAPEKSNGQCTITTTGCPTIEVACADSVNSEGSQGKFITWTQPDFTLSCSGGSDTSNFQMYFDLPESSLAAECWEFNRVQRTGQSSDGWVRLWQSTGTGDPYFITPLTYFEPNTDVKAFFTVESGENFTWWLELLDMDGNIVNSVDTLVDATGDYTLQTPDTTGAFYLKFRFTTTLSSISNKNTVDDIVHDGVLIDVDCASGIEFTVSRNGPQPGFFVIGDTTISYVATYTPADGSEAVSDTCTFDVTVEGVNVMSLNTTPETCSGSDGTVTIVASSPTSATPDLEYNLDGGGWISFNSGETISGLSAGTHTLDVRDLNLLGDCAQVELLVFTVGGGADVTPPVAVCQDATVQLDASGNVSIDSSLIDNGSSDNCGIASMTVSPSTFDCSDVGDNTVTLTVYDAAGNSSTCTSTVTVEDDTAPVAVCENITVQLDDTGNASITANDIDDGSSDACGIQSLEIDVEAFTCANVGTNNLVLTVTDNNGNTSTCDAVVTVEDNVAPVAVCQNVTVQLDASGNASITTADINNGSSDACGIASLSLDQTDFDCSNVGTNTVTLTVTDNNGNTSTCDAVVTVEDNVAPVAVCQNVTVQLDASGNASITTADIDNGSSDACGIASLSLDQTDFDCSNVGANTVTLTVTDNNGNTDQCTAVVTVEDNVAPTFTAPANTTIYSDASCLYDSGALVAGDVVDEADNCDVNQATYTDQIDNSNPCAILITRTWSLTDIHGNAAPDQIQLITIADTVAPVVVCPGDQNRKIGDVEAVYTVLGNEFDIVSAAVECGTLADTVVVVNGTTYDIETLAGFDLPLGENTITWQVRDNCGNVGECSFMVDVTKSTIPYYNCAFRPLVMDCGDDYVALANEWIDSVFLDILNNATDDDVITRDMITHDYDGVLPPVECDANSAIGKTVTFTITDDYGNTFDCSKNFVILDLTPPTVDIEASDLVVECDGGGNTSEFSNWLMAHGGAEASDICTGINWSYLINDTTINCGSTDSVSVIFTATDSCGNASSTTAAFVIKDGTAPVLTLPPNITLDCDVSTDPQITGSASAIDNCDESPVVSYTDEVAPGECANEAVISRTWTATDACGNITSEEQTITIQDNTPPTFNEALPGNLTVECDNVPDMDTLTASDNCGDATITVSQDTTDGDCANEMIITRTWTATDNCGNTTVHTQTLTVQDITPPVFDGQLPASLTVDCDNVPEMEILTATDNCGEASVTMSQDSTARDCPNEWIITRNWTAADECGNTVSHTQVITTQDFTAPEFNEALPADITVECDAVPDADTLTASDNCGDATVLYEVDTTEGECPTIMMITRTWTASDQCGNTNIHTQTITVQDTKAPEFNEELPADITLDCNEPIEMITLTATDDCGTAVVTVDQDTAISDETGELIITRTWVASDECENKTSHTQVITIKDFPIEITSAQNQSVLCSGYAQTALNNWLENNGGATVLEACGEYTWSNNFSGLSNGCGPTGSATVTFTATDESGNSASTTATFRVTDNIRPAITNEAADMTVECDGQGNTDELEAWLASNGGATAIDACSSVRWSNNFDGLTSYECGASATVIFNAYDACGNSVQTSATFTIIDTTTPAFTAPADITIYTDENCEYDAGTAITGDITDEYDLCDTTQLEATFTDEILQGECAGEQVILRNWSVADACGNTTSAVQTITVRDNIAPVLSCNPITVYTDETGGLTLGDVELAELYTVSDNCTSEEDITVTVSQYEFGCGDAGVQEGIAVVITATDLCGNVSTCSSVVTVMDTIAPTAVCSDFTVALDADGNASITHEDIENGSTDNCSIDTMYIDRTDFTCADVGENEVTLTVVDAAGNVGTCTAIVTVTSGAADCGQVTLRAAPDILTLVVCPGGTVSGEFNLLDNDEGIGSSGVTLSADNIPDNVQLSITDGEVLYVNEEASAAVIEFTYTICSNADPENCASAEATIRVLLDTDCDGVPDIDDIDDDDDGMVDSDEEINALNQETLDSDGDGIVDRLDIDSDNDGIPDNIEWQSTIAEGGEYDYILPLGTDSNGNGWDDAYDPENGGTYYDAWDMDYSEQGGSDAIPDYLDEDSDDDGIQDWIEGWDENPHDTIADVTIGASDSDGDGLYDNYDSYDTGQEWLPGLNAIGSYAPLQDMAGDTINGIRDWRDNYIKPEKPDTTDPFTPLDLFIPEGFSPNTDNRNDYFEIQMNPDDLENTLFGEKYPDAHLWIYNRWGNLVYEKEHYGNYNVWGSNKADAWWDGRSEHSLTIGSGKVPPATYIYILILDADTVEKGTLFVNY